MPVVVKTRAYDTDFYRSVGYVDEEALPHAAQKARRGLGDDGGKRRI
jgi:hypothetical protein